MTAPPSVIRQLFKHPLTDNGIAAFLKDWEATGQKRHRIGCKDSRAPRLGRIINPVALGSRHGQGHFLRRARGATLRDRLGAAESAKEDLIAFARGHSGATAAIHAAVIALMEADSLDALFEVVTQ